MLHTRLDHPLQLQELTQCCTLGWTTHYSYKSSRSAAVTVPNPSMLQQLPVARIMRIQLYLCIRTLQTTPWNKGHTNFLLNKTGLQLSKQFPYIGASADSMACCDCHGGRVVTVKCPYKHMGMMTADPTFCLGKELSLKHGHAYYTQAQFEMYVYDESTCNFVVWTSNVCIVVEVALDADLVEDLTRFNKICHPSQRPRWQVDKEAIGLSRVQQCSSTYNPPS